MADLKPFAFVLMPFSERFSDIYKLGIQAVARDLDIIAERVDEQVYSETILERIYRQIEAADFIIADMSGKNANVFYEVGYAHAREKLCTLLTQDERDIPFDLRHHRHIVYGGSIQTLQALLRKELVWLKQEAANKKAEAMTVQLRSAVGLLVKTDWSAHADVTITFDVHNKTNKRTPELEAIYFHTGSGWSFRQGQDDCPSAPSEHQTFKSRHFVKAPVNRLSPGAWAQIKIVGSKRLWGKWEGTELKDEYRLTGEAVLEIVTSEGSYLKKLNLDVTVDDIPF